MTSYDVSDLKKRLAEAPSSGDGFAGFQDYFFDNYLHSDTFMRLGNSLSAPRTDSLVRMLGTIYSRLTNGCAALVNNSMIEIREWSLIHGAMTVNGKLAFVVYFADIELGMLMVHESFKTGEVNYIRFTCGSANPTLN